MTKALNLEGEKFGRLLVIKRVENDKKGESRWLCKCECGNTTIIRCYHLTGNKIKSCGCIKREMLSNRKNVHHQTNTRLYRIWIGIKQRCLNSNHKNYNRYKGRGIKMCKQWENDFMSFYNWAIANGYRNDLTIDRIDVNGNYEPSNCRWATRKEQANNTTRNHFINFNGCTRTMAEWIKILELHPSTFYSRVRKGLPIERCFYVGKLSNNGKDFL